jgi:hypothetical protein
MMGVMVGKSHIKWGADEGGVGQQMHKHDMPITWQARKPETTHYGMVDSVSVNQRKDNQVGRVNQRNHEATAITRMS